MNKRLMIKNGHVVDPRNNIDGIFDIFVENGKISGIYESDEIRNANLGLDNNDNGNDYDNVNADYNGNINAGANANVCFSHVDTDMTVIDAAGLYVFPGFIDLHVHFREPGFEYKETIKTGARAAAAGGYTTVCMMPNTSPVIDNPQKVTDIINKIKEDACVNTLVIGAITVGENGKELTDIKGMKEAGAVAISDDGKSVMDERLMKRATEIAKQNDIPIFDHCEDINLVNGGVMNYGKRANELDLPGIKNIAEEKIEERDIELSAISRTRLHLCHCTTEGAVKIIREAKKKYDFVTAETCPHYIALTEDDILSDDGNYKMNPPLRTIKDRDALIDALCEGTIDVISTDHAPHSKEEKDKSMRVAPFGIVGLETSFPVCYTALVKTGRVSLLSLIKMMSTRPAEILNAGKIKIPGGGIGIGDTADIAICDLTEEYEIDPTEFKSKGTNTPFAGKRVSGRVQYTIVKGEIVYDRKTD